MLDIHTHVFCWGENPQDGFLSEATRRRWLTRVILSVTGVTREPGETLSEKMRNRLVRHVETSRLTAVVVLAQDAVYRDDGSTDQVHVLMDGRIVASGGKELASEIEAKGYDGLG